MTVHESLSRSPIGQAFWQQSNDGGYRSPTRPPAEARTPFRSVLLTRTTVDEEQSPPTVVSNPSQT
jgi:hypothetical protein